MFGTVSSVVFKLKSDESILLRPLFKNNFKYWRFNPSNATGPAKASRNFKPVKDVLQLKQKKLASVELYHHPRFFKDDFFESPQNGHRKL
jgi:hypothetical protein